VAAAGSFLIHEREQPMQLRHLFAAAVTTCVAFVQPAAFAQNKAETKLSVGDKAPKIEHVTWHQGKVEGFQPGHVYILDFWAPWCGPCIAAMPHMNEISAKYKDKNVHVVGLSIWPRPNMTPVADFLANRKANDQGLNYIIGEDNSDGHIAKTFMQAAGQNGIPTVMIINQTGHIVWIGHPMGGMDDVLEKVVSGNFDVETARREFKAKQEEEAKINAINNKLRGAYMAQDWETVLSLFDEIMAINPKQYSGVMISQYLILVNEVKDGARAKAVADKIMASDLAKDAQAMNSLAWMIVSPDNGMEKDARDLDLATKAIDIAVRLTEGKSADVLDTQARVFYWKGDYKKAVEVQTKAIELAEDEQMKAMLAETLDEYKALLK
jgi:thiol-disulfide isomerase/thioredoxin